MGQSVGQAGVVRAEDQSPPPFLDFTEYLFQGFGGHLVHISQGFIEEENLRIQGQRPGNSHALYLSARELSSPPLHEI